MSSIGHYPVGMMKRPPYLAGILLFALVFGAEPAHAAQVVSLTLEQVVDRADVIAWGTVTEAASELVPGAPGRIQTRITLLPSQRLAGAPGQDTAAPVIFYVAGGVMGRIGQVVPGSPRVRVGDEVVMLLSRQAISHRLIVVGLSVNNGSCTSCSHILLTYAQRLFVVHIVAFAFVTCCFRLRRSGRAGRACALSLVLLVAHMLHAFACGMKPFTCVCV